MGLPQIFIASIETALNRYMAMDPESMSRLASMEGRVIAIEITGFNQILYLFPAIDGFMVMSDFDGEADTIISGSPLALARLSLENNVMPVLFSGDVTITGDTRLGHSFKKILAEINIDWEEQLSRFSGDMIAHQIGNRVKRFSSWFKRSKKSFEMDLGEYLQEETQILPARAEIKRFIHGVDSLREGLDRLQARINRLNNNE